MSCIASAALLSPSLADPRPCATAGAVARSAGGSTVARRAGRLLLAPAMLVATSLQAQEPGGGPPSGFTIGAGVLASPARDLDGGGDAAVTTAGVGLSHRWTRPPGAFELGLRYDTEDWDFDAPGAFGGTAPWGRLHRLGLSAGWQQPLGPDWRLGLRAAFGLAAEDGADLGESRTASVGATVTRSISPGLTLGLGLAVSREIGRNRVRAFPLIDWRFADGWRLGSVAPGSAVGPVGLEVGYRIDPAWNLALGIGTGDRRYRLDDQGPSDGGIAQTSGRPVFLRLGWAPLPGHRFELIGGVDAGGELRLEDRQQRLVREVDLDRGPFIGLGWSSRF